MAKSLLNGVNEVLQRMGIVASTNALSSLTDSGKQIFIDQCVQAINETVRHLYLKCQKPMPKIVGSTTLTLATGDDDYNLALTDVSRYIFPFVDATNQEEICEYEGGWEELYYLKAMWTVEGLPEYAVVSPIDGQIIVDQTPTANENGNVYTVYYEKDGIMSSASDTFPFDDSVFVDLVPAMTDKFRQIRGANPDRQVWRESVANAAKSLSQVYPRKRY